MNQSNQNSNTTGELAIVKDINAKDAKDAKDAFDTLSQSLRL